MNENNLQEPLLQDVHQQTDDHCHSDVVNDDGDRTRNTTEPSMPAPAAPQTIIPSNPWRNRNVILTLIWGVVAGVADSVWGNTVLSGFLLALAQAMHHRNNGQPPGNSSKEHDNTIVGTAEAVQGIAMLISALPVGLVADWFGKAKVVAYGGVLCAVTIVVTLFALAKAKRAVEVQEESDENQEANAHGALVAYYWMLVALALWGVAYGIIAGPSQALFADSIPRGQRSSLLTWQYSSYLLSSVVGPIVGVVLLHDARTDESWSMSEIYPVFVLGILLEIPGVIVMFLFSDKCTIVEQEDSDDENTDTEIPSTTTNLNTSSILSVNNAEERRAKIPGNSDLERPLLDRDEAQEEEQQQQGEGSQGEPEPSSHSARAISRTKSRYQAIGKASIPYVLFLSSLVTALGSGASVKYFPLFFRELGFSSAFVQGLFVFVPLSISAFSFLAQRVSQTFGRIETTILWEVVGSGLLFYMTWLSRDEANMNNFKKYQILTVYLLRTGIMNACYPLLESVLMDEVPSNQRARWKSLESIAAFGWTGSALVGGILADDRSYRFTFAITAATQLVGTLILIPLRPFVEPEVPSSLEECEIVQSADAA